MLWMQIRWKMRVPTTIVLTVIVLAAVVWGQSKLTGQAQSAAVPPQTVTVPQTVIQGVATTVSGQPLAGTTLFLRELPGTQGSSPSLQAQETVVTDAQGHFTWTVPPEVAWNVSTDVSTDSSAPDCYALPLRDGWRAAVALAPNSQNADADSGRRDLYERAALRCETHWRQTGKNAQMSVVAPETGKVTLSVRGPGGQVLAGRAVEIVSVNSPFVYR